MGVLDVLTDEAAQVEYDTRLLMLQEQYGALPPELQNALIYQAISEAGLANLAGCPFDRVSIHTKLAGLRRLTPDPA